MIYVLVHCLIVCRHSCRSLLEYQMSISSWILMAGQSANTWKKAYLWQRYWWVIVQWSVQTFFHHHGDLWMKLMEDYWLIVASLLKRDLKGNSHFTFLLVLKCVDHKIYFKINFLIRSDVMFKYLLFSLFYDNFSSLCKIPENKLLKNVYYQCMPTITVNSIFFCPQSIPITEIVLFLSSVIAYYYRKQYFFLSSVYAY